jgi:hypothetical protein
MSHKFDPWSWVWELAFPSFVIFLFATIAAYYFPKVTDLGVLGRVWTYPYRSYTVPLGICAFVFLFIAIVAIGISVNREPESRKPLPTGIPVKTIPTIKYCPHCGNELPKTSLPYCPFCGKSLKLD